MSQICKICLSPYRSEIVSAWKQGVSRKLIYEKYASKMGYTASFQGFFLMVTRHIKSGHKVDALLVPQLNPALQSIQKKANIESLVKRMTELAVIKVDNMNPEDVKITEVLAGHRVLLESKKLKLSEDAMMIALSKMFGPPIKGEIQEEISMEEELNGLLDSGRNKDAGVEPENPPESD